MFSRLPLLSLLLATLLVGCGGRLSMRQLEQLEARVNAAPDSVLRVLTSAELPRWGERRALHALLTVQAQDKKYIDVADDSLIRVATRYYEHRGSALRRLQAFYYHGRVYANAGHRHEAMTAYTRAKDFVPGVDAPYPVGLLYAQLGVFYGNDYDYSQGLAYMEKSQKYYEQAGMERLQYLAKRSIGQFYLNMHNFTQAVPLLNEVLAWGEAQGDSSIIYSTLDLFLRLYDATGNTAALDALLNQYPIEAKLPNATTYGIIAHYYALKDDNASAESALTRAWDMAVTAEDTAMLWQKNYQVYKALDLPYEALHSHEALLAHQDSVVRITLQQPLIASQLEHYQTRLEVEELRNLNYRFIIGITALVLLIVAALLFLFIRNRFRQKQELLDNYIELADELRHTLYNKEVSIERINEKLNSNIQLVDELRTRLQANDDAMQAQIAELFGGQFQMLNRLSETYYQWENREGEAVKDKIFDQVKAEIEGLRQGDTLADLEEIVNKHLNHVVARLRDELPYLKEKDFVYLTFFYARFSGKAISLFMGVKRDYVYKIKERLCNRIKTSDAPSKAFFLSKLP